MHYEAMMMDARREGRIEKTLEFVKNLLREGFSKEDVMAIAECTEELFFQAKRELDATAMVSEKN